MFANHHGNDLVNGGTYLCLNTGEFTSVPSEGGRLPGPEIARYQRVNPLVALIVGPVVGMLFVIFLPLAVPLFLLWQIAKRLGVRAPVTARRMAEMVNHRHVAVTHPAHDK